MPTGLDYFSRNYPLCLAGPQSFLARETRCPQHNTMIGRLPRHRTWNLLVKELVGLATVPTVRANWRLVRDLNP